MNTQRRSSLIARAVVFSTVGWTTPAAAQSPAELLPAPAPLATVDDSADRSPTSTSLAPTPLPTDAAPAAIAPNEYWLDSSSTPAGILTTEAPLTGPSVAPYVVAPLPSTAPPTPAPDPLVESFGYDTIRGQTTWIIAKNDRFGWVSFESLPSLKPGELHGLVGGFGLHFLDGPIVTDMPARLFDFSIGYQARRWFTPNFGADVVARVGAFSDFEGSARDGIRYPSHAVTFLRLNPNWELLLGVDYLDRDDISLLPVFGAVWAPNDHVRIDAVFPRPCAAVQLGESNEWAYIRGQLGGGTWAIERVPSHTNDNATYRDVRLVLGLESRDTDFAWTTIEIGYIFARELSYRSSPTDFPLSDAVMLNFTNTY